MTAALDLAIEQLELVARELLQQEETEGEPPALEGA